ncbi:MAG TPA: lamin tail domain-containing protein, partial [Candidatus Paceibacterota bacterium]|nr:lamin tail domain-containing protein [Candidatus Paceibacterota bacterium]
LGLDPNGAFYKMYNSAESPSSAEKKTRKHEGFADLKALIDGMSQANIPARQAYMYDHLDLPEMINFLAAKMITADTDCCHKNYYLYRDTEGTEEWQAMPWDVDLSFGRNWTCGSPCLNYFDETLYTNQSIYVGRGNRVFSPLYDTPATRQMFLRRLRTLMDTMLQPPGTPASADAYRQKILALREQFAPDAALDLAKWGTWGRQETIYLATDRMFNEFFPGRRAYLFRTLSETNRGDIPSAQRTNVLVQFSALEYRPASGNPREEWLSISNANPEAVDISGWRLEGGVRFRFKPGTIIPSRSAIYVSPDVKAFRARAASPKGGERLLVVGPYEGNLSAWGESLNLVDSDGRLVSSHHYTGSPSPAQQYLRITEIHYHPRAWPEDPLADPEEFEFIELRNIGPIALDLRGIRLTEGIAFDFTSGTLAQLAAGARILVVANTHLFAAAYGSGLPIAGQFNGSLDNGGERLRLEDEFGEKILDFEYGDEWHPATDGQGFSLEIIDETGSWSAWGDPARWRPSTIANGTPGRGDAAPSLLRLSQPTDGAVLPAGSSLEIAVQTESPVDPIDRVRLFADDRPLAELPAAPFAMTWSGAPAGLHTLMAVGNHRSGLLSTSAVVTVALATVTNILFDLVPAGAPWKYQDNGSGPSASWTAIDFEDASWKSGIAELGYGDDADGRPETTRIDYGPNPSEKYATCHFRHGFVLEAMLDPQELELNLLRDDGAVVYLNGAEVFRSNMPDGAINDLSLASSAVSGADETRFFTQSLSSSQLRKGENVIAVEVHQSSRSSSDLSFDLSLRGRRPVILPVILRQPGNQVIPEGSSLALAVWAGGTGPLRYQWQFEGVSIAGATNSTFTIASVTSDQWGVYTVVVSNEAGSLSSQPFRVSSGTQPPVPGPDGLLVPQSTAVTVAVDSLLENDADPDGDGLSLTRVDPTSSQGASLVLASGWVTYTPPPGFQGQDSFNYIVHDTKNLSATGRVDVLVYDGLLPVLHQLRLDPVAGIYRLRYTGTPARILELQRSTDLVHWSILQQTPIPPHGVVEYLELHPPVGEAYYRAVEK